MTDEQTAVILRSLDDGLSLGEFETDSQLTVDAATLFFQRLFVQILDFEQTTSPNGDTSWQTIPVHEWSPAAHATTARLVAIAGPFRVVYVELESLTRSAERTVVQSLARVEPTDEWAADGTFLVVFHAPGEGVWHLVSPYDKHTDDITTGRPVLRRFTLGGGTTHLTVANALASISATEPHLAERIHEAFRVEPVIEAFYEEYARILDTVVAELREYDVAPEDAHRYAHVTLTRLLSLYYLQQFGWFGGRRDFVRWFFDRYRTSGENDALHETWLSALFFEGLNRPKGTAIDADVPADVASVLSELPCVDVGLFTPTDGDERALFLSDSLLTTAVREFLERYTYTVTEGHPTDIEIAIDPGMLGTIYESFLAERGRGEAGIFYTPRTEVDLMCRMALYEQFLVRLDTLAVDSELHLVEFIFGDSHEWDHSNELDRDELAATLRDLRVVDPACGSGAFLIGTKQVVSELYGKLDHTTDAEKPRRNIEQNLYGVDIKEWAVNVAAFRLWLSVAEDNTDSPPAHSVESRISSNLRTGDSLVGTVDRSGETNPDESQVELDGETDGFQWRVDFDEVMTTGGFDIVLTNPPYVHHQNIVHPKLRHTDLDRMGHSERQSLKLAYKDELISYVRDRFGIEPYRRSDLYLYFVFNTIDILRDEGTLALITSNTWLDNSFGKRLQQGVLELTDLSYVVDNREKRSFTNADVNTVITVANKSPEPILRGDVGFVALGDSYERVTALSTMQSLLAGMGEQMTTTEFTLDDERGYVQRFDGHRVVRLAEDALWRMGGGTTPSTTPPHADCENSTPVSIPTGTYTGNNWGQFLRAPSTYFELLEAGADVFVPLSKIATVGSYLNTGGADEFFFVEVVAGDPQTDSFVTIRNRGTGDTFTVESEFIIPFVESPRQVSRIDLSKAEYDSYILCIPAETDLTDTKVSAYVEWGEGTDRQYHATSGRSKVSEWWVIGNRGETSTEVVWPNRQNARHFVGYNPTRTVTHRFYRLEPRDDVDTTAEELAALLNFTPTALFTEVLASAGLGQGVLDVTGTTLRRVPVVDPAVLTAESRLTIRDAFRNMSDREIGTLYDELGANTATEVSLSDVVSDRRQLDAELFGRYLALDIHDQQAVYAAIIRTINDRLDKSRSV